MQPDHLKKRDTIYWGSLGCRNTKIHPVSAIDRISLAFRLSAGQCHDATHGRLLLEDSRLDGVAKQGSVFMLMDRGFITVVSPKSNRKESWEYDSERYKCLNEIERLFRRLKRFRMVCTGYEKLDEMYLAVLTFARIVDELILC